MQEKSWQQKVRFVCLIFSSCITISLKKRIVKLLFARKFRALGFKTFGWYWNVTFCCLDHTGNLVDILLPRHYWNPAFVHFSAQTIGMVIWLLSCWMLYLFYTKKECPMAFLKFSWRVIRALLIIVATVIAFVILGALWPLTVLLITFFPGKAYYLLCMTPHIKVW